MYLDEFTLVQNKDNICNLKSTVEVENRCKGSLKKTPSQFYLSPTTRPNLLHDICNITYLEIKSMIS